MNTNFWANLDACNILLPILRSGARVVNMSSMCAQFAFRDISDDRKQQVHKCTSIADVENMMTEFVKDVKEGVSKEKGWAPSAYGMTKLGVAAMTFVQQKNIDADTSHTDIVINSCCPGYVSTDMSSFKGRLTVEEGAVTPVYLALLPPNVESPRGEFIRECKIASLQL